MAYDQTVGDIDFAFLPPNFHGDVQVFLSGGAVNAAGLQKWRKPRAVTMCYMITISGGGGGGGGASGASTTARGGGGGGFSGGLSKMIVPAILVPDVLWIQIGPGGKGGAAGAAGGIGANGGTTFITYSQGLSTNIIPDLILSAAGGNPTVAGAGTSLTGGAGGIAGAVQNNANLGAAVTYGLTAFLAGVSGGAGGAQTGANGASITATWNLIGLSPGTGGAGVNSVNTSFVGGTLSLQAPFDFADGASIQSPVVGGTAGLGGTGVSGNGNAGLQYWKPFYMTGGSGGGSSDNNIGGNGGNGGIGCGGGGGGAGTTGGTGGNGGDGCVIIISW